MPATPPSGAAQKGGRRCTCRRMGRARFLPVLAQRRCPRRGAAAEELCRIGFLEHAGQRSLPEKRKGECHGAARRLVMRSDNGVPSEKCFRSQQTSTLQVTTFLQKTIVAFCSAVCRTDDGAEWKRFAETGSGRLRCFRRLSALFVALFLSEMPGRVRLIRFFEGRLPSFAFQNAPSSRAADITDPAEPRFVAVKF